jgi:hypothetical protein
MKRFDWLGKWEGPRRSQACARALAAACCMFIISLIYKQSVQGDERALNFSWTSHPRWSSRVPSGRYFLAGFALFRWKNRSKISSFHEVSSGEWAEPFLAFKKATPKSGLRAFYCWVGKTKLGTLWSLSIARRDHRKSKFGPRPGIPCLVMT